MSNLRVLLASDERNLQVRAILMARNDLTGLTHAPCDLEPVIQWVSADLRRNGIATEEMALEHAASAISGTLLRPNPVHAVILCTVRPSNAFGESAGEVARRIRSLPETMSDSFGVRTCYLPIVFYSESAGGLTWSPIASSSENGPIEFCRNAPTRNDIRPQLADVLVEWRSALMLELDYVGYAICADESGYLHVNHVLRHRRRESRLLTLSGSPSILARHGYLSLPIHAINGFAPYAELQGLLNELKRMPPVDRERRLQQLLQEKPVLLYRGMYNQHFARPRFQHPDPLGRHIEPDFILRGPNFAEILEIKSAEMPLLSSGAASQQLKKAVAQLLQYAEFFANPNTTADQLERLGQVLAAPRKVLLIGRRGLPEEQQLVASLVQESQYDITLMNYDDLVDFGECQLLANLNIADAVAENLAH